MNRTETQVGYSEPLALSDKANDQQIKGTVGITE